MLNEIIVTILSLASVLLIWFINQRFSIFSPTKQTSAEGNLPNAEEEHSAIPECTIKMQTKVPESERKREWILYGIMLVAFQICGLRIIYNTYDYLTFLKLFGLMPILALAGCIDYKKKIIPNYLVLSGIAFRAILYLLEFFLSKWEVRDILINDAIGLGIGFGVLLIAALVSKGAVGFGDVKLFAVVGLCAGAIGTYYTLLFSLITSVIVSLFLIALKRKTRKESIPFAPCIAFGYAAVLLSMLY